MNCRVLTCSFHCAPSCFHALLEVTGQVSASCLAHNRTRALVYMLHSTPVSSLYSPSGCSDFFLFKRLVKKKKESETSHEMLAGNTIQLVPQGYTVAERIMEMQLIGKKKKRVCVCAFVGKRFHTLRRGRCAVLIHVTDTRAQNLHLKEDTKTRLSLRARRASTSSRTASQNRCKNMEMPLKTLKWLHTKV